MNGRSFFTAGLILAIMIVPIITSLTREVFDTTPTAEKEAAYGLGATRWEMIRASVFSHSKGGMVGAVTLGLGRAMGETIAVALVIGSNPQITAKLFPPGYSMPSVIANEFGESSGLWRAALDRPRRRAVRHHDHREPVGPGRRQPLDPEDDVANDHHAECTAGARRSPDAELRNDRGARSATGSPRC